MWKPLRMFTSGLSIVVDSRKELTFKMLETINWYSHTRIYINENKQSIVTHNMENIMNTMLEKASVKLYVTYNFSKVQKQTNTNYKLEVRIVVVLGCNEILIGNGVEGVSVVLTMFYYFSA